MMSLHAGLAYLSLCNREKSFALFSSIESILTVKPSCLPSNKLVIESLLTV